MNASNGLDVGVTGVLSLFQDQGRGDLVDRNDNGLPLVSILINSEEAITSTWDRTVNTRARALDPDDSSRFQIIGLDSEPDRAGRLGFGFSFFRESEERSAFGGELTISTRRRVLVINGTTGELLVNFQPGRDGDFGGNQVLQNNMIIEAINNFTPEDLAPAPADPFVTWAEEQNIPEAERAPDADPDSDGLVNLLEYAYGTNPIEQSQAAAPRLNESGQFVFQRSKTADVAPFVIMTSSSLEPESFQPFTPTNEMNVTDQGDTELVTMELPSEERLFVRLEISRSE